VCLAKQERRASSEVHLDQPAITPDSHNPLQMPQKGKLTHITAERQNPLQMPRKENLGAKVRCHSQQATSYPNVCAAKKRTHHSRKTESIDSDSKTWVSEGEVPPPAGYQLSKSMCGQRTHPSGLWTTMPSSFAAEAPPDPFSRCPRVKQTIQVRQSMWQCTPASAGVRATFTCVRACLWQCRHLMLLWNVPALRSQLYLRYTLA
jgi:hypothetical protein